VLPEDVIQFQLSAVDTFGIPAVNHKALFRFVHRFRAAILSYKEDSGFKDTRERAGQKRGFERM
jgi:hypothetical protein